MQVERFYVGRPEGPIKTFPLRGIKDSPPYLHDGRCPTLHDVVEFFNLVLGLKLNKEEKLTVFLVEQNAFHALKLAHRGYVMVNGRIALSGTGRELLERPEVKAAYLEGGRH